jgi:hypothetical protein
VKPLPGWGGQTFGQAESSAGGFNFPLSSKTEYSAENNPALAPRIRGAGREEAVLIIAPFLSPEVGELESAVVEVADANAMTTDAVGANRALGREIGQTNRELTNQASVAEDFLQGENAGRTDVERGARPNPPKNVVTGLLENLERVSEHKEVRDKARVFIDEINKLRRELSELNARLRGR